MYFKFYTILLISLRPWVWAQMPEPGLFAFWCSQIMSVVLPDMLQQRKYPKNSNNIQLYLIVNQLLPLALLASIASPGQGQEARGLYMDVCKVGEGILTLRNRSFARFNSFSRLGTAEIFAIFQIRPVFLCGKMFVVMFVSMAGPGQRQGQVRERPIRLYFSIFFQITIASFFV